MGEIRASPPPISLNPNLEAALELMEKGCRRAGPAPVRPTRFAVQQAKGPLPRITVTAINQETAMARLAGLALLKEARINLRRALALAALRAR
jgi:hypothetical protein